MTSLCCNNRRSCVTAAVIASAIIGVLTAFFLITGVIDVGTVFLWVVFGIAVVSLGVLVTAAALARRSEQDGGCICRGLNALLIGILGTILFSVILLAVGITATSLISAILLGLLLFFFSLTLTSAACFIRCLFDCGD